VKPPKNVGKAAAVSELNPRSKYSKWVSFPIHVETVPVNWLPNKSSTCKLVSFPNSDGMEPLSEFKVVSDTKPR